MKVREVEPELSGCHGYTAGWATGKLEGSYEKGSMENRLIPPCDGRLAVCVTQALVPLDSYPFISCNERFISYKRKTEAIVVASYLKFRYNVDLKYVK